MAPLVTIPNRVLPLNTTLRLSDLFSVSNLTPGRAVMLYRFRDNGAAGGTFLVNGAAQPANLWRDVTSANLNSVLYRSPNNSNTESINVQVWDGVEWSNVATGFLATGNSPPILTPHPYDVFSGEKLAARRLFTYFDQDGDNPVRYDFIDRNANANGGYFEFKGQRMASNVLFTVQQSELNRLFYVGAAAAPQTENIGITVYDGFLQGSTEVAVSTQPKIPTLTIQANHYLNMDTGRKANTITNPGTGNLFTVSDAVERIRFKDGRNNANGGHFVFKGLKMTPGQWFTISRDSGGNLELDQLEYRGGERGPQGENVLVQTFSNGVWGQEQYFLVQTLPNLHAPVLNLFSLNAKLGSVFELTSLFTASDADGDLLQRFYLYDTGSNPNSGYFSVNGVRQAALTWIELPWDQRHTVKYHMPTVPGIETVRMWVSDGHRGSTLQSATMQGVETPRYEATENNISLDTLENVRVSTLFQQQDAGPAYTRYQIFDENFSTALDRSARFYLRSGGAGNSADLMLPGQVHTLTAEQFSRLDIQGAEADWGRVLDGLLVRATNDITGWSEWRRINVNTDPIGSAALLSGTQHNAVISGGKTVITYSFIDGGNQENSPRTDPNRPPLPWYYREQFGDFEGDNEALNPHALGQPAREAMRQVFAELETFANLDFVEVPYQWNTVNASMVIGAWGPFDRITGAYAYAYYPSDGDGRGNPMADIWFNLGSIDWDINLDEMGRSMVQKGTYFYHASQHEVGHALGLKHSFENTPHLSIFNDYSYNTVMSYKSGDSSGPPTNPIADIYPGIYPGAGSNPGGYMLYDIVELQRLYGANMNYRTGDDQYMYYRPSANPLIGGPIQHTIWDAGGNDTLNLGNSLSNETIDLRPGTWTTVHGIPQVLRIGYGVDIEHARGGAGNDTIIGNELSNMIWGGAGEDIIRGQGGNDWLYGGTGDDTYVWSLGDGHDRIIEEAGQGERGFDIVRFRDPSGTVSAFDANFRLRRLGNDLRIDFHLDNTGSQGSVTIANYHVPGQRVETVQFFSRDNQISGNIDLTSAWDSLDNIARRFRVTNQSSEFGSLLALV